MINLTTIINAVSAFLKGHDNSRTKSDDVSADASGKDNISVGKVGGDLTISSPPAPIPPERVDVPKHTYDESLKNAVRAKALELQIEHDKKTALLQAELNEFKNRQNDPEKALQEEAEFKAKIKADLEREGNEAGAEKMAEAQDALENGNFSKAIEFFTEIKKREELGEQRSGRASFALGEIAEQEIRWDDAAEHYLRAAQLDPCFETLIMAQKFAIDVGNYHSAVSLGEDAQKAAIEEHGELSEQHANSLNNLSGAYRELREYKKAEPFLVQALEILEKVLGKKHPYIANCKDNLGLTYLMQGKREKAEQLINESLALRQEIFKEPHPDTAISLNSLAGFYTDDERWEESLPLYRQSVEILESTLGNEHPTTKKIKKNYEGVKKIIANAENGASQ